MPLEWSGGHLRRSQCLRACIGHPHAQSHRLVQLGGPQDSANPSFVVEFAPAGGQRFWQFWGGEKQQTRCGNAQLSWKFSKKLVPRKGFARHQRICPRFSPRVPTKIFRSASKFLCLVGHLKKKKKKRPRGVAKVCHQLRQASATPLRCFRSWFSDICGGRPPLASIDHGGP